MGLNRLAMVTSPTGNGVIAMGGHSSGGRSKAMFELSQSMEWIRLEQSLQIECWGLLAIPIPDELVYKKVESEDKDHHCSLPEDHSSVKHYIVKKFVKFFKLFK